MAPIMTSALRARARAHTHTHAWMQELTALGEAVGTVSKGISTEQILALPLRQYSDVVDPAAACPDEQ
jgi:hypothetical protein